MASVEKVVTQVEKTITVDQEDFVLTLSAEDASVLHALLGCLPGSVNDENGKYYDTPWVIYHALTTAGVVGSFERGPGLDFHTGVYDPDGD